MVVAMNSGFVEGARLVGSLKADTESCNYCIKLHIWSSLGLCVLFGTYYRHALVIGPCR